MTLPLSEFLIRPLQNTDSWLEAFLQEHWGSPYMVIRGESVDLRTVSGFAALIAQNPVGLITFRMDGHQCEITSLDSLREGIGIGSALLDAVLKTARTAGCTRAHLITTNDNLHALRFYQRRSFSLCALYPKRAGTGSSDQTSHSVDRPEWHSIAG